VFETPRRGNKKKKEKPDDWGGARESSGKRPGNCIPIKTIQAAEIQQCHITMRHLLGNCGTWGVETREMGKPGEEGSTEERAEQKGYARGRMAGGFDCLLRKTWQGSNRGQLAMVEREGRQKEGRVGC